MAGFDTALSCVREGSHDLLLPEKINRLARDSKIAFRETPLTPGKTLQLFAQQIAHGNIACSAVHRLGNKPFTDSAWCQARKRLPTALIEKVQKQLANATLEELKRTEDVGDGAYHWRGHRLVVIDGSTDSMPDTPALREHYGVPTPCRAGLGFPMSHLMLLMDHRSGLLLDCHDTHVDTHDAAVASKVHDALRPGDVMLGDDAFSTYAHIALVLQANCHVIMPVHHRRHVDFTPGRAYVSVRPNSKKANAGKPRSRQVKILGKLDQIVEYFKPPKRPDWMDAEQWKQIPESITVRETQRVVQRNGFRPIKVTIVSTLLDPESYPADELIDVRLTRWMVETNLRHLKITLGMEILKCQTIEGVDKERRMFLLVYNLLRRLMLQAARLQKINVNRLSFADALAWVRYGNISLPPTLKVNPIRLGRLEPRALKRGKKQYPYMTKPRDELKAQLRAEHCLTA